MGVRGWPDDGAGGSKDEGRRSNADGGRDQDLAALERVVDRHRRSTNVGLAGVLGWTLLVLVLASAAGYIMLMRMLDRGNPPEVLLWPLAVALLWATKRMSVEIHGPDERPFLTAMARVRGPDEIDMLLRASTLSWSSSTQGALWSKIADVLPQLAPPQRAALTPQHFRILRARLAPGGDPTYRPDERERAVIRAILEFMAQTGHMDVRQELDLLSEPWRHPEVRAEAGRCRERLLQVQADAERSGALLRPAEAPPGETLLRPAGPVAEEQLLRAAEGDAE